MDFSRSVKDPMHRCARKYFFRSGKPASQQLQSAMEWHLLWLRIFVS